jgi:hypothetical protein
MARNVALVPARISVGPEIDICWSVAAVQGSAIALLVLQNAAIKIAIKQARDK